MNHVNNDYIELMNNKNEKALFLYAFSIIKLFIFITLTASFLFGSIQSIRKGFIDGFIDGIMFGFIGAITVVPILVLLDAIQKIFIFIKYKIINFRVDQERRFIIKDNYFNSFNKLVEIISNLDSIEIHIKNEKEGVIEAIAKRSWKSFGENIKVKLRKTSEDKSVVAVLTSKPRIFFTVIDYSKNFENIEKIMNKLTAGNR